MDLAKSMNIAAAGMKAQGTRLKVIAENIANSGSTAREPGGTPYRRQTVTFANELDRALSVDLVRTSAVVEDKSPFGRRYQPGHPAADAEGYVLTPNVNGLIEMADMREAQRSYEANLKVIRSTRAMIQQTIELLR